MAYTGTTNYGFQKPAKENAFTVDDLNNALDKIDETIKDGDIVDFEMEIDELNNLNVILKKGDNSEFTDSVSLTAVSGVLVVQNTLPGATMTIVKTATNQQVYSGGVTPQTIPTGAGSVRVTLIQFGKTITKDIQVAGETLLDLNNDIVTITLDSKWFTYADASIVMSGVNLPSSFQALTGGSGTIVGTSATYKWDNVTPLTIKKTVTFNSTQTITATYSEPYIITNSGAHTLPAVSKRYVATLCGGGGGGGGGGFPYQWKENDWNDYDQLNAGSGGKGGNGGAIQSVSITPITRSINVTIGTGGNGGDAGTVNAYTGVDGTAGGTTSISGAISTSASGGAGGQCGSGSNLVYDDVKVSGSGGTGGNGSNGTSFYLRSISSSQYTFGEGGSGGSGHRTESSGSWSGSAGGTGENPSPTISGIFAGTGKGGNGGRGGNLNTSTPLAQGGYGATGGYGIVVNGTSYGRGGNGGNGGSNRGNSVNGQTNGTNGTNGVVVLEMAL